MSSFLGSLSARLVSDQPVRPTPKKSAGVAVIFREAQDDDVDVLLLRRAEREDDAWSGQVAFPGGMVGPGDRSFADTAKREAGEEVGIDLAGSAAVFLGYMHDFKARTRDIVVIPSVFRLVAPQVLTPNAEVAACDWASMKELTGEAAQSSYLLPRSRDEIPFPCIVHRGLVIWGLTERILSALIRDEARAKR